LDGDLGPDFKAAGADSWSDCDHQIVRIGTESVCHGLHGLRDDLKNTSPPSGVNRSDCPVPHVGHEDREAIGCADCQSYAWLVRYERIALAQDARVVGNQNSVGVNLPDRCEVRRIWQARA